MPVTIRDIARRLRLSTSTVSLGLRGMGKMSDKTRRKIQAIANETGYQPLPLVSKALSIVRKMDSGLYRETLAFLTEFPEKNAPFYQKQLHTAALERAHGMGFKLEQFLLSSKPSDHRKL